MLFSHILLTKMQDTNMVLIDLSKAESRVSGVILKVLQYNRDSWNVRKWAQSTFPITGTFVCNPEQVPLSLLLRPSNET